MFVEQPNIIFNGINPISKRMFTEKYGSCNRGQTPKHLKIGRDYTNAEVDEMFGPLVEKHSYCYNHTGDEELCKRVERMCMILHQNTVVPSSCFINCSEAHGFVVEAKEKEVNWIVLDEWTI